MVLMLWETKTTSPLMVLMLRETKSTSRLLGPTVLMLHANATGETRAQVCLQIDSGHCDPTPARFGKESRSY